MTALSPELAVAYLRLLSCDTGAVGVHMDGSGAPLAGVDPPADADVIRARRGRFVVSIALGGHGIAALAQFDAESAVEALSPEDAVS